LARGRYDWRVRFLDWLNRGLVVVLSLLAMVVGLAVALAPSLVAGALRQLATALERPAFTAEWLVLLVVALAVAAAALVLLVTELRVRGPDTVALAGDPAARLSAQTIVQRLRSEVEALDQVDQARPAVTPRRRSVDVVVDVTTAPGVDVPAKAAEVSEVARRTVEALGLKLGKLSVHISQTTRAWPASRPAESPPATD
jgi:hypothetical protein